MYIYMYMYFPTFCESVCVCACALHNLNKLLQCNQEGSVCALSAYAVPLSRSHVTSTPNTAHAFMLALESHI